MEADTLSIIRSQTGVDDDLYIERTYFECNSDIVKTIMALSDIKDNTTKEEDSGVFVNIRKIMDEKEMIYFNRKST